MMSAVAVLTIFIIWGWKVVQKIEENYGEELAITNYLKEKESRDKQVMANDYWDGEDIDYDTGEVGANARASVRHPKNRDRAYSGSVERFHDGGW